MSLKAAARSAKLVHGVERVHKSVIRQGRIRRGRGVTVADYDKIAIKRVAVLGRHVRGAVGGHVHFHAGERARGVPAVGAGDHRHRETLADLRGFVQLPLFRLRQFFPLKRIYFYSFVKQHRLLSLRMEFSDHRFIKPL